MKSFILAHGGALVFAPAGLAQQEQIPVTPEDGEPAPVSPRDPGERDVVEPRMPADRGLIDIEDPRVGAQVRSVAGDLIGHVTRLEFETPERSVIAGYLVDARDLTGRETQTLYFEDSEAVWTDLGGSPVLTVTLTAREIERMPSFYDERPAAFDYDDRWTGDVDAEAIAAMENPSAAPAPGEGNWTLDDGAEPEAVIDWQSDFETGEMGSGDWLARTVYSPEGEPIGVVSDVRPEDGPPQRLIVRTLADYFSLGLMIDFAVEDIEAIADQGYSARVSAAALAEKRR